MEKLEEALSRIKQKIGASSQKAGESRSGSKDWVITNTTTPPADSRSIQQADLTKFPKDANSNNQEVKHLPTAGSKASGINDMIIPDGMNLVDNAYEEKMAAFEVDCNDGGGAGMACHHVAEFYSVVKDAHDRAKITFEKNCYREKDPYYPSCFNLAKLYLAGRGNVKQSDDLASKNFKRACDNGHLQACYHQGVLQYLLNDGSGSGENRNNSEQSAAIQVLQKACNDGEIDSCYFAGSHFLNKGISDEYRNPQKAVELLKFACDKNHAPSCFNLAVLYNHGDKGIPPNKIKYEEYRQRTQQLVGESGSLKGTKTA